MDSGPTNPPPAAPPPAEGTTLGASLAALLRGDWVGTATVAGVGVGLAAILATVSALLLKQDEMGVRDTFTAIGMLLAGTFGAGYSGSFEGDDGMTAETSFDAQGMPLLFTLTTLTVMIRFFRRRTASYSSMVPALGDALRVATVTAVLVFFSSLVLRSGFDGLDEDMASGDGSAGASRPGALFMTFLVVTVVLGLACLLRRDWLGPRLARAHDALASPLRGLAAFLWTLPAVGLVGVLLVLAFGGDDGIRMQDIDDDPAAFAGVVFSGAANFGLVVVGLGSGAPAGVDVDTGRFGGFGPDFHQEGVGGGLDFAQVERLAHWTDYEPGLWATPLIALAVIGFTAWVVVRRSPDRSAVAGNLGRWLLVLVPTIPVIGYFASGRGSQSATFDNNEEAFDMDFSYAVEGFVGVDSFQLLIMMLLIGGVLSLLLIKVYGDIDALARAVASLQERAREASTPPSPDRPPPGAPGPTGPPPGWSPPPSDPPRQ